MWKHIIILCLVYFSLLVLPQRINADIEQIEVIKILNVKETISLFATKYGINREELLRVANCESRLNPDAINYNDGGKGKHSVGVMQFQETTFDHWSKILGEDLDYYSYYDQIKLGAFMFSKKQQNQWSCYRLIRH